MESVKSERGAKPEGRGFEGDFVKTHALPFRVCHILLGIIMLVWPYIFIAVVWSRHRQGGLQAPDSLARLMQNQPRNVNFLFTTIVVIVSTIITYLFITASMCLYRDWFKPERKPITLLPLVHHYLRRDPDDWPVLQFFRIVGHFNKTGWCVIGMMVIYWAIFTAISPGLNALLIPHSFSQTSPLQGYELDFSSTNTSCVEWITNHPIPSTCNWRAYNGFEFTECLEQNQLVDVLESGRNNMRAPVGNDSDTLTFTQLGGISFRGPIRGVLPIGQNGIQAFNTLQPLTGRESHQSDVSHNYTVDLQGISSNVKCQYTNTSTPIIMSPFQGNSFVSMFNASCPSGDTVPAFALYIQPHPPLSNNTLAGWPCKTSPLGTSYDIYLYGDGNYIDIVGNMTCTVSPLQHTSYNVTYTSNDNLFTTRIVNGTSSNISTSLLDRTLSAIPHTISEAQALDFNSVAESVITYAIKYYGFNSTYPYVQNDLYLRLYEALIQGMLEYEATYTRMIYSSYEPPPACNRIISGTASYEVIGWEAEALTAVYLIPLTLANLSSIIMLLISLIKDPRGEIWSPKIAQIFKHEDSEDSAKDEGNRTSGQLEVPSDQ